MTAREAAIAVRKSTAEAPVDFSGRDLSGLDLAGIDFKGAKLARANLYGADLTAANTVATKVATYVLVAKSLMQGRADVGFFLKRTYDELSGVIRRELRPIVESQIGVIRHTLLGGPRTAPLTAKLQQALFTMTEDPAGVRVLESLGLGGWVPQQPEETEFLIDVIETLSE